jgi:hypothetical protein
MAWRFGSFEALSNAVPEMSLSFWLGLRFFTRTPLSRLSSAKLYSLQMFFCFLLHFLVAGFLPSSVTDVSYVHCQQAAALPAGNVEYFI